MHQPRHVFAAVADPTRREILDQLRRAPMRAGDIADRFPISRPAISRHLRVLRKAGLVAPTKRGRERFYALRPEPLRAIDHWLDAYRLMWAANLVALKEFVEGEHDRIKGTNVASPPNRSKP